MVGQYCTTLMEICQTGAICASELQHSMHVHAV
jgi:hypothetical protein